MDKGGGAGARRSPFLRSLRSKVLLVTLAVLIVPPVFAFGWSRAERNIEWGLRSNVADAADEAVDAVLGPPDDDPDSHTKARAEETPIAVRLDDIAAQRSVRIRLVDQDGRIVVDTDHDQRRDLVHQIGLMFFGDDGAPTLAAFDESLGPVQHRPEVLSARTTDIASGCRTSTGSKLLVCHGARWVWRRNTAQQVVYVQESSRRAVRVLYDVRYQIARLTLLVLPIALGIAWWLGTRIVRPIEQLRKEALQKASSARPEGQLSPRGRDEVGDLSEAFNTLLGKLERRRHDNEQFVADLVHEFKNPVAAIRACAETLAPGKVDDARAARLARVLGDSSARLDALVSQFLELARAEAGMPKEVRAAVDLAAVAAGAVEAMRLRHPSIAFELDSPDHAVVVGVPDRLDSLVRNLLDNAAAFAGRREQQNAPVQGAVTVQVHQGHGEVVIRVVDNGPGMAPDDMGRVFDRFYTRRGRGSGLGLALAKAIAEAHQGTIEASSEPGKGATFTIRLPVGPA